MSDMRKVFKYLRRYIPLTLRSKMQKCNQPWEVDEFKILHAQTNLSIKQKYLACQEKLQLCITKVNCLGIVCCKPISDMNTFLKVDRVLYPQEVRRSVCEIDRMEEECRNLN